MSGAQGVFQPNMNNIGAFFDYYAREGVTAMAGGGQSTATILRAQFNRVTTVASANDSVRLGRSEPGRQIWVVNQGANTLAVYPDATESINGLGASAAFSVPVGAIVFFSTSGNGISGVSGNWYSQMETPTSTLPTFQDSTTAAASGVIPVATVAGAQFVTVVSSGATALTSPTAAALLAQSGGAIGTTWRLRIINTNGGTLTITWDATVTQTVGANTLATNTWREYDMQITGAATATAKGAGTGTFS